MPRINNKGLVYADRTPKDIYYYYQAAWRKDIPVLHIASRDWTYRSGVQQGNAPVLLPVKVYSNLPEVELFIDGKSIGKQQTKELHRHLRSSVLQQETLSSGTRQPSGNKGARRFESKFPPGSCPTGCNQLEKSGTGHKCGKPVLLHFRRKPTDLASPTSLIHPAVGDISVVRNGVRRLKYATLLTVPCSRLSETASKDTVLTCPKVSMR